MTPELIWTIASSAVTAAFAAGGAFAGVRFRLHALEQRIELIEDRTVDAHLRIDRLLEEPHHAG